MTEFIVKRDGQKDLKFNGELLAGASNRWLAGREQTRWTKICVYKTESGKYVVAKEHITLWQGEENSYYAEICNTPEDVMAELTTYDEEGEYFSNLAKKVIADLAKEAEEFEGFQYEEI